MKNPTDIDHREAWNLFISNGGDEAFSAIYFGHYDLLYHIGLKFTSDIQVVEDSIQNIFIYLLNNRNKLSQVDNVRGYLLKSFRRQLFHDLKKQKRLSLSDQLPETQFDYFNTTETTISDQEGISEMQQALKQSLCKLTAKQQEMIYLRFDCDLDYQEIANIFDISVDSCYKSVYRSIKAIKVDLDQMLVKGKKMFLLFIFCLKKSLL